MLRLRHIPGPDAAAIFVKLELLSPGGSVKDRLGAGMIARAERDGRLQKGGTIIEPTAGNIALDHHLDVPVGELDAEAGVGAASLPLIDDPRPRRGALGVSAGVKTPDGARGPVGLFPLVSSAPLRSTCAKKRG